MKKKGGGWGLVGEWVPWKGGRWRQWLNSFVMTGSNEVGTVFTALGFARLKDY